MSEEKWSTLTRAIKETQPIDWAKLDFRIGKVQNIDDLYSAHLRFVFFRNDRYPENTPEGQTSAQMPEEFRDLIRKAWQGEGGLFVRVEGDIPLLLDAHNKDGE